MSLGEGLDDFLVSLANGLSEARDRLAEATSPTAAGTAPITYQLPRLDFELKVNMTTETISSTAAAPYPQTKRILVAMPSSRTESSSVSVMRGSFVAVPIDGGIPRPDLTLAVHAQSGDDVVFEVRLTDMSGQPLTGVEVELNVDRDMSEKINGRPLAAATGLSSVVVITDERGEGRSTLHVASSEPSDTAIAVVADAAGARDTLIYRTTT